MAVTPRSSSGDHAELPVINGSGSELLALGLSAAPHCVVGIGRPKIALERAAYLTREKMAWIGT